MNCCRSRKNWMVFRHKSEKQTVKPLRSVLNTWSVAMVDRAWFASNSVSKWRASRRCDDNAGREAQVPCRKAPGSGTVLGAFPGGAKQAIAECMLTSAGRRLAHACKSNRSVSRVAARPLGLPIQTNACRLCVACTQVGPFDQRFISTLATA
jgi:hypothetical protein